MYIVGCDKNKQPIEIAASCDDIHWNIPNALPNYSLRNDMFYPSGVICFWSNDCAFKVGASLSSTDIYLVKK